MSIKKLLFTLALTIALTTALPVDDEAAPTRDIFCSRDPYCYNSAILVNCYGDVLPAEIIRCPQGEVCRSYPEGGRCEDR
jgi:hypothetical protein